MYKRILKIDEFDGDSAFLFGARQTGKSTLLRERFSESTYIDLLDTTLKRRFQRRPGLLCDMLSDADKGAPVIIDEIPEVPELLNEVHRLMSEKGISFILCGSSARKLKRKGWNTPGGRAFPIYLFPFVSPEIPNFDLDRAVSVGMLPPHYLAKNPERRLAAYIDVYLKEEIEQEALVRNFAGFQRFLEVAALTDGEILNYSNIAADCAVSVNTVKGYFSILQDTLLGFSVPAFSRVVKRRLVQAPKFYYFDVGVANHLLHRTKLSRGTPEYGHALEHLVMQELRAWLSYTGNTERLSYWRTYSGTEVDAVIGDARVAIEIKSAEEVQSRHLKGLKSFAEDYPQARLFLVSLDPMRQKIGNTECLCAQDFFRLLWNGGI